MLSIADEENMKRMIRKEIEYNKTKLRNKLHLLKSRQNENNLLKVVTADYESYYAKMKQQEEKHQQELQYVSNYLKDMVETNDLTDSGLKKVTKEQNKILQKITLIKEKINSINI